MALVYFKGCLILLAHLYISQFPLLLSFSVALTSKVVDRLLSGVVTFDSETPSGKLGYKDFVWFLISEEDKTTTRR